MDSDYNTIFFSIILHIFLLFTFLSLLFWLVTRKLEEKSLYKEINKSIEDQLSKISINSSIFTEDDYSYLKNLYSGENVAKKDNNNLLLKLNIIIIIALFLFLFLSVFIRYKICKQKINFSEILIQNLIILIIAGIIEYFFLTNVVNKYVSIMPSEIPKKIEKTILDKIK